MPEDEKILKCLPESTLKSVGVVYVIISTICLVIIIALVAATLDKQNSIIAKLRSENEKFQTENEIFRQRVDSLQEKNNELAQLNNKSHSILNYIDNRINLTTIIELEIQKCQTEKEILQTVFNNCTDYSKDLQDKLFKLIGSSDEVYMKSMVKLIVDAMERNEATQMLSLRSVRWNVLWTVMILVLQFFSLY